MHVLEAESFRVLRDVLEAKEVGFEAEPGEAGGCMRAARSQLPVEPSVGEAHHAVVVRIAARGQAGPARAALRRSGEGLVELDSSFRERVQVRADNALDAIAVKMAAQVVSRHDHHVSGVGDEWCGASP